MRYLLEVPENDAHPLMLPLRFETDSAVKLVYEGLKYLVENGWKWGDLAIGIIEAELEGYIIWDIDTTTTLATISEVRDAMAVKSE